MRSFNLLFIFAASVLAFKVPPNQPNGVYSVQTHSNGTETHTLIKQFTEKQLKNMLATRNYSPSGPASRAVMERQIPGAKQWTECGGYSMNVDDTNMANIMLDAQCGDGAYVGPNLDFYSIYNCVVSYFCNESYAGEYNNGGPAYYDSPTQCFSYDRQQCANLINAQCGPFWAGWVTFTRQDNQLITWYAGSYGWEDYCGAGHNFCGRGV